MGLFNASKEKPGKSENIDAILDEDTHAICFASDEEMDELYNKAVEIVRRENMASISLLQQNLNLSYSLALNIIDKLEEELIIGPFNASKSRIVLTTESRLAARQQYLELLPVEPILYDDWDFKVPLFLSKRNSLAMDLMLEAQLNAKKANKTRSLSEFILYYDLALKACHKIAKLDGKVTSISTDSGHLFTEYIRLEQEYQKHIHDVLERGSSEIVTEHKGIYKYDREHTKMRITAFKKDFDDCCCRLDVENRKYACALYQYLCHECNLTELLVEDSRQRTAIASFELSQVDGMGGHEFERWCAELLRKNGFSEVEVTRGSGDQGVDITAVKDGIHYAIQCKCYTSDLGNVPVQEVYAGKAIYKCQIGAVMTNQYFTIGGIEAAVATGILLWDRDKLQEMINIANRQETKD